MDHNKFISNQNNPLVTTQIVYGYPTTILCPKNVVCFYICCTSDHIFSRKQTIQTPIRLADERSGRQKL